jgi:hypothetical protein
MMRCSPSVENNRRPLEVMQDRLAYTVMTLVVAQLSITCSVAVPRQNTKQQIVKGAEGAGVAGSERRKLNLVVDNDSGHTLFSNGGAINIITSDANAQSSWQAALAPLIGVVIGGGISLLGLWLKDHRDRIATVRRWFEQEYVFGAISGLVGTLNRWRLELIQYEGVLSGSLTRLEFPLVDLGKTTSLLRDRSLEESMIDIVRQMRTSELRQDKAIRTGMIRRLEELQSQLIALQTALLKLEIKTMRDVHTVFEHEEVATILARLKPVNAPSDH